MTSDTVIVSDLHLGSPFSQAGSFRKFIKQLPDSSSLVLNGDTVDVLRQLGPIDLAVMDDLATEARTRSVVWVRGNHDRDFVPPEPGNIQFTDSHSIDKRVLVTHGHQFDPPKFARRMLTPYFRIRYDLYRQLGGEPLHVAAYAKRFHRLYKAFKNRIGRNAAAYAARKGFTAVACGHTHSVDDITIDGIRIFNTGTWTEPLTAFLHVHNGSMDLNRIPAGQYDPTTQQLTT